MLLRRKQQGHLFFSSFITLCSMSDHTIDTAMMIVLILLFYATSQGAAFGPHGHSWLKQIPPRGETRTPYVLVCISVHACMCACVTNNRFQGNCRGLQWLWAGPRHHPSIWRWGWIQFDIPVCLCRDHYSPKRAASAWLRRQVFLMPPWQFESLTFSFFLFAQYPMYFFNVNVNAVGWISTDFFFFFLLQT